MAKLIIWISFALLLVAGPIVADDQITTTTGQPISTTLAALKIATTNTSILQPNYDNVEYQMKVFDERQFVPLILSCNINITSEYTNDTTYKLQWARNGKDVSIDPDLSGRYAINEKEHQFIIQKPNVDDAGLYTCSIPDLFESQVINVVATVYMKEMPESVAVVEDEKLIVHCAAVGTKPEIRWFIGNETYVESDGRVTLKDDEDGIHNGILIINQATLNDQGYVNCTATNLAVKWGNQGYQEVDAFTYVRVKGKLAALWPFIGICTEVFILCTIILVYEKKRHRSAMDDSDDEHDKLKQTKK